MTQRIS
jgi:hypothetical protein